MNCGKHPDKPAINTCEICNNGICVDCKNETSYFGQLCVPCAINEGNAWLKNMKSNIKKLTIKTVILALAWVAGLVVLMLGMPISKEVDWSLIIVGLVVCGLPTGIVFFTTASKEANNSNSYKVVRTAMGTKKAVKKGHWGMRIFFFCLGTVLGFFASPAKVVMNILSIKQDKKEMPIIQSKLDTLSAMK